MKPYCDATERNRAPILALLKGYFSKARLVLEIGSGTGQHAAYFAPELPHLVWQPSDVAEHLPGIRLWTDGIANVRAPVELDVEQDWPDLDADAAFSANTCHIMSWPQVERMFRGFGSMPSLRVICIYGPFHYGGKPTAESNASFDAMLRQRDPKSGVRDFEAVRALAEAERFLLEKDNEMPANNRLLVFRRPGD